MDQAGESPACQADAAALGSCCWPGRCWGGAGNVCCRSPGRGRRASWNAEGTAAEATSLSNPPVTGCGACPSRTACVAPWRRLPPCGRQHAGEGEAR